MKTFQETAFYLISRIGLTAYACFPVFGRLKASFAVIRNGPDVLLIERNDGRGLCFPGGIRMPWETDEKALEREVNEETGLTVTKHRLLSRYDSQADIPVTLSIFEVEATGEIRGSWEGTPCWIEPEKALSRVLRDQRRIIEELSNNDS